MRIRIVLALLIFFLPVGVVAQTGIFRVATEKVVEIDGEIGTKKSGGTCFLVSFEKGLFITANHVVENVGDMNIIINDFYPKRIPVRKVFPAPKVIATRDIAVLELKNSEDLKYFHASQCMTVFPLYEGDNLPDKNLLLAGFPGNTPDIRISDAKLSGIRKSEGLWVFKDRVEGGVSGSPLYLGKVVFAMAFRQDPDEPISSLNAIPGLYIHEILENHFLEKGKTKALLETLSTPRKQPDPYDLRVTLGSHSYYELVGLLKFLLDNINDYNPIFVENFKRVIEQDLYRLADNRTSSYVDMLFFAYEEKIAQKKAAVTSSGKNLAVEYARIAEKFVAEAELKHDSGLFFVAGVAKRKALEEALKYPGKPKIDLVKESSRLLEIAPVKNDVSWENNRNVISRVISRVYQKEPLDPLVYSINRYNPKVAATLAFSELMDLKKSTPSIKGKFMSLISSAGGEVSEGSNPVLMIGGETVLPRELSNSNITRVIRESKFQAVLEKKDRG